MSHPWVRHEDLLVEEIQCIISVLLYVIEEPEPILSVKAIEDNRLAIGTYYVIGYLDKRSTMIKKQIILIPLVREAFKSNKRWELGHCPNWPGSLPTLPKLGRISENS